MHCDPRRASVCAGHEQEVICVHNFMPRAVALETRARLDERHAQLLAGRRPPRGQLAAASRRPGGPRILPRGLDGPRPEREAGSEFNQTEVPRCTTATRPEPNPNPNSPSPNPNPNLNPNPGQVLRLTHRHETGLRAHLWHGAQRANEAGSWGYRVEPLPRNLEALQSVRYEAPHGWYAEHVDTRFTWSRLNHTYSERVIAAIVQLSDRHDRAVKRPWLAAARAATHRCRSPPAGSGLPSELPSGSEKGSPRRVDAKGRQRRRSGALWYPKSPPLTTPGTSTRATTRAASYSWCCDPGRYPPSPPAPADLRPVGSSPAGPSPADPNLQDSHRRSRTAPATPRRCSTPPAARGTRSSSRRPIYATACATCAPAPAATSSGGPKARPFPRRAVGRRIQRPPPSSALGLAVVPGGALSSALT